MLFAKKICNVLPKKNYYKVDRQLVQKPQAE